MTAAIDDIVPDVLRLLAQRSGMTSESFSVSGIAHAVRERMSPMEAESPHDYLRRLADDPSEFQELLEELVVPETWFFRDPLAFRCLHHYLTGLKSASDRPVALLSIACSTGEEVYSLAMTVRNAGVQSAQYSVLGTDISRRSLEVARNGLYPSRSFRENDPRFDDLRQQGCERAGSSWRVRDELRERVQFRWDNVAGPEFLTGESAFDVIFCRNVLIYFHAEARRTVACNLRRLLAPGGFVCVAPAEARILSDAGFRSLGGDCPFAFRIEEPVADSAVTAPARPRMHATPKGPSSLEASPKASARRTSSLPAKSSLFPIPAHSHKQASVASGPAIEAGKSGAVTLQAAEQAANSGRLAEADALCGQVLAQDPANAEAHYLRGVIRKAQGELDEARKSLEKALYLDPRHQEALVQMMLLAEQRGDLQAAANYRRRGRQASQQEVG